MREFDVIVAADLSAANGATAALADAIKVLLGAGYRVALVHVGGGVEPAFTQRIREVLHNTSADLLLPSDDVASRLLVVCSPEAFAPPPASFPIMSAEQAIILVNESRAAQRQRAAIEAGIAEAAGARPDWAQWEPAAFGKHVEELIGAAEPGQIGTVGDAAVPDRRRGVLIIDLTGVDRPDTLLPAVRRETTDPDLPRVVATPAARAAEHAGDLAVETFPRTVVDMPPDRRATYLADRIVGLLRSHQPHSVFVLDDDSAGFDLAEVEADVIDHAWCVTPGAGSDGTDVDDELAQRVNSVLPPGWSVVPLASRNRSGSGSGSGVASATLARLRRWGASLRSNLAWRPRPSGALVVAPQLHSRPEDAIRALRQKQIEAGGMSVALLAPPDWEPAASKQGIPIETLIPEPTWHTIYGAGWADYVSERVREVRAASNAATVVFAEDFSANSPALHALEVAARDQTTS